MKEDEYSNINLNTEKILYYILVSGGVIIASIIAPRLPYNLMKSYIRNRKFKVGLFNRDLYRLKTRGDIWMTADSIRITKQGRTRVLKYQLDEIRIKKPHKWDQKWRMVIFDIPNNQKRKSNSLRQMLYNLGFEQYQKSIFIYPYPCQNEIDFLKEIFEVSPYVKLILAEKIDEMEIYKRKFRLT